VASTSIGGAARPPDTLNSRLARQEFNACPPQLRYDHRSTAVRDLQSSSWSGYEVRPEEGRTARGGVGGGEWHTYRRKHETPDLCRGSRSADRPRVQGNSNTPVLYCQP
jgi:hypothetical protein